MNGPSLVKDALRAGRANLMAGFRTDVRRESYGMLTLNETGKVKTAILALGMCALLASTAICAGERQLVRTEKVAEGVTHTVYSDGSEELYIPARGSDFQGDKRVMQFIPSAAQTRKEPKPRASDRKRGYITFSPLGKDGVLPDYIPAPSEIAGRVSIFASPGEYEPATLAVRPLRNLGNVTFLFGGFDGPRGARIPASSVDVYIAEPTVEQTTYLASECRWAVKWLRPGNAAQGLTGKNIQVYLDIHVPNGAKPGLYSGNVKINPQNGKASSFTVNVEVLPLRLSRPVPWGMFRYDWIELDRRADFHQFELAEMRRAGLTQCVISPCHMNPSPGVKEDGSLDFRYYDGLIELYKEAGFEDPPIISMEGLLNTIVDATGKRREDVIGEKTRVKAEDIPKDVRAFAKRMVRGIYDHSLEAKWPNYYVYLADEPDVAGTKTGAMAGGWNMETAKFMGGVLREVAPEMQIAETAYYWDAWEKLHNLLDLNMVLIYGGAPPNSVGVQMTSPCSAAENRSWRELAEKEHSKMYGFSWIGHYETLWEGRRLTFFAEKGGFDGMMIWVQWLGAEWRMGDADRPSFDPYMFLRGTGKGGPFCFRDNEDRVWRSLALIGIREGIDDSRYVRTLRRAIEDATITGSDRAADAARQALEETLEEVHWAEGETRKTPWDATQADAARRKLARAAIECAKSTGQSRN